jgi:hypothetical protein
VSKQLFEAQVGPTPNRGSSRSTWSATRRQRPAEHFGQGHRGYTLSGHRHFDKVVEAPVGPEHSGSGNRPRLAPRRFCGVLSAVFDGDAADLSGAETEAVDRIRRQVKDLH